MRTIKYVSSLGLVLFPFILSDTLMQTTLLNTIYLSATIHLKSKTAKREG